LDYTSKLLKKVKFKPPIVSESGAWFGGEPNIFHRREGLAWALRGKEPSVSLLGHAGDFITSFRSAAVRLGGIAVGATA